MNDTTKAEDVQQQTRAELFNSGGLIDVSEIARDIGLISPVAFTRGVWDAVVVPSESSRRWGQAEAARAQDVLFMFKTFARNHADEKVFAFPVVFVNKHDTQQNITLVAVMGRGDDGEPVISIALPVEVN